MIIPKRLVWMAVGAGAGRLGRRKASRVVDRATGQIEARLGPGPARVVRALPGDLLRVGGTALASGQVALGAARTGQQAAQVALGAGRAGNRAVRTVTLARRQMSERLASVSDEWRQLTDLEQRRLRADYLRHAEGEEAAFAALLDVRTRPDPGPLPETPDPVPSGRRRFRPPLPSAPVNRVQRTYRRARKAWD